jgi:hypothetical protein
MLPERIVGVIMAENSKAEDESDTLSVSDMNVILKHEIIAVMKAADLRLREFSGFTAEYAAGKITAEEAMDRYFHYQQKWGEALLGVPRAEGLSDAEIVATVNEAAGKYTSREEGRKRYDQLFSKKENPPTR